MTSPIQGAGGVAAPVEALTSLSSDALLEFGAQATENFDRQIVDAMNRMRGLLGGTDALGRVRQELQTLSATLMQVKNDSGHEHRLTREQYEQLRELGVLDELGLDPEAEYPEQDMQPRGGGYVDVAEYPSISPAMLEKVDAQLEIRQNELNSDQQQQLLFLQETMRQRSQLAQLLSNVLRERGETMAHIVRNVA